MFTTKNFIGEFVSSDSNSFVIFNIYQKNADGTSYVGQAVHSLITNNTEIKVCFLPPLEVKEFVLNEITLGVKEGISALYTLKIL